MRLTSRGHDAFAVTTGWPKAVAAVDAKATMHLCGPIRPNRALYWTDAFNAIDAVQRTDAQPATEEAA